MISQLPKWIEFGAFILSVVAGCVNAVGLLGFEHQAISHLSGTATLVGSEMSMANGGNALLLLVVILSFLLGASMSGFWLNETRLKLGRRYETLLILEGVLLLISFLLLNHDQSWGLYFASVACGLQNAMATTYSGAIVRTTHVTGIITDLGIMMGQALRGKPFDRRKGMLFLLIILGFVSGGFMGAVLYNLFVFGALLVPAVICFVLAVFYRYFQGISKPA